MITTGSGAVKIEGTDNWRNIFDAQNETAEAVDQLTEDMAIIVSGNQTSHTGGAAAGQFVLVRNSTITDITDGLYTAAQAIPANTVIDKTYLTAVSGGALNALNSKIADFKISEFDYSTSITLTCEPSSVNLIIVGSSNAQVQGAWIVMGGISTAYVHTIEKGSDVTVSASGLTITVANGTSRNSHGVLTKLSNF